MPTPFVIDPADHARAEAVMARLALPEEVCAVVRLRVFAGLSVRDMARASGLSKAACERRWTLFERTLMRDCFDTQDFADARLFLLHETI